MSGIKKYDFNLGVFLKNLRLQKGISQDELAKNIGYSVRQIQRFESDNPKITQEGIAVLSDFYNIDISIYQKISKSFASLDDYNKFIHLRKSIENGRYEEMKIEYELLKDDEAFQDGEKLQLVLYCKATLLSRVDENYIESNEVCYKALDLFNYHNYIEILKHSILTEISYPILAQIRYNLIKLGEEKQSNILSVEMYKHFKNLVFKQSVPVKYDMYYMQKYYIASTYNLSSMYYKHNNYIRALIIVRQSIKLSNDFGFLNFIHYLYKLKFKIYYMMEDFDNSKKSYLIFKNICEITGNLDYLNETTEKAKTKLPLLFTQ